MFICLGDISGRPDTRIYCCSANTSPCVHGKTQPPKLFISYLNKTQMTNDPLPNYFSDNLTTPKSVLQYEYGFFTILFSHMCLLFGLSSKRPKSLYGRTQSETVQNFVPLNFIRVDQKKLENLEQKKKLFSSFIVKQKFRRRLS